MSADEIGAEGGRRDAEGPARTAVLLHLSGPLRGTVHPLRDPPLLLGTSTEADLALPRKRMPAVCERHALLEREGDDHVLRAVEGSPLRVNGRTTERHRLRSGDVVELGDGGPLLRYRVHEGVPDRYKSLPDAFRDCVDCARHGSRTPWGRAARFLEAMPHEILTQTAPSTRALILLLVAGLVTTTGLLTVRSWRLERRLEAEAARLEAATRLLEEAERHRIGPEELERIRAGLSAELAERIEALEARGEAVPVLIETASRSVAFIQGSYGFLDPETGAPLRLVEGPEGRPLADPRGQPIVSPDGEGPVMEIRFTGTAFVVDSTGLLLTNRHLARPWEFDAGARAAVERGLVPVMRRMLGYLPELDEPFPVEPVAASESADLALLRTPDPPPGATPLVLDTARARPGQEVVVLGYPTGIRALLARTNPSFVDTLMRVGSLDSWQVAERLSAGGHIAPLASRGIVGQVGAFVVYDAETTRGGSGGPVLALDGRVVAVTVGILPEFGGSNLGIPASEARRLLEEARRESGAASAPTGAGGPGPDGPAFDPEAAGPDPLHRGAPHDSLAAHERT